MKKLWLNSILIIVAVSGCTDRPGKQEGQNPDYGFGKEIIEQVDTSKFASPALEETFKKDTLRLK